MNVSFFIARKYFSTQSSKNLIYRIGLVACLSVTLSTASLLLVASIFNGFEDVIKKLFATFDPALKIGLHRGKYFSVSPDLLQALKKIEGVQQVTEVVEECVLLTYRDRTTIAKIKGVSNDFDTNNLLAPHIVQGSLCLQEGDQYFAIIGAGIQYALGIQLYNVFEEIQVFLPKKTIPQGLTTVYSLCNTSYIKPGAIFAIEKHFDDQYIIADLNFVTQLLEKADNRTALEIRTRPGASIQKIKQTCVKLLPPNFQVLTQEEQQVTLMRTIHTERVLVFTTMTILVMIAALNIFFILSMLVLVKEKDIRILYTLGATRKVIKYIFIWEGLFIGLSGSMIGMIVAALLTWLQQYFNFLSINTETSLLSAYPIKGFWTDYIYVGMSVLLSTLVASYRPSIVATALPKYTTTHTSFCL
jgi:lipoprotein-releasing system permease protein